MISAFGIEHGDEFGKKRNALKAFSTGRGFKSARKEKPERQYRVPFDEVAPKKAFPKELPGDKKMADIRLLGGKK